MPEMVTALLNAEFRMAASWYVCHSPALRNAAERLIETPPIANLKVLFAFS
jgi:hypothetical protein